MAEYLNRRNRQLRLKISSISFFIEIQIVCLVSILVSVCRHRTTHNVAVICNTFILHWECSGLEYPSVDAHSWSLACWFRDGTSKLCMRSSFYTVHNSFISVAGKVLKLQAGWWQSFVSSRKLADSLWGPKILLLKGHRGSFPTANFPGREVHQSPLSPRLRMGGSIPLLPLYAFMSWARTNLFIYLF